MTTARGLRPESSAPPRPRSSPLKNLDPVWLFTLNVAVITFARSTLLGRPGGLTPSRPASPLAAYRLRHRFTVGLVTPTRSAIS